MARKAPNGFGSIRKVIKNGRSYYEARYTDPVLHKQKSLSATTEAECRRKLMEVQASITRGDYVTPDKIILESWLHEWLRTRENITDGTRLLYKSQIETHIIPRLGRIRLQDLRYVHCQNFVNELTHDKTRSKPLSPKTVSNIIGVLSKALNTAVRAEIIAINPAAGLDLPRKVKAQPKVMESGEQSVFLDAIKNSPYRVIFLVGLHTGMRISEILGLSWKAIDFKTGEIKVNQQLKRQRGEELPRTLSDTKTHRGRTIVAPPFVIDLLRKTSIQQKEMKLQAGPDWNNAANLIFTRGDGSPIPHTTIQNAFKRVATQIGRPDLSFHSLRHTFITDEIRSGTDVKTVAETAGHSTIAVTMDIYAAATNEMKTAAAQRRQEAHERNTAKNA